MTPFVPQYTPQELEAGKEFIKTNTPESIEKAYRMGQITLKDKVMALRAYGQLEREIAVKGEMAQAKAKDSAVGALGGGATGEVKFWFQNTVKEFQSAWSSAKDDKKAQAAVYSLMGALEGMKAFDLPGNIVERWALDAGVSPGLARAANWALWIPSNFMGVSTLLKGPLKLGGMTIRGTRAAKEAVGKEAREIADWITDPVGMAVKQAREIDKAAAMEATKAAVKGKTEGIPRAVTAAAANEAATGIQAVKTATPTKRVFRGGDNPLDKTHIDEFGVSVSSDESIAKQFGANVESFEIPSTIKITKAEDLLEDYAREIGSTPADLKKQQNLPDMLAAYASKRGGVDAIDMGSLGKPVRQEKEIRIINSSILKSEADTGGVGLERFVIESPEDIERQSIMGLVEFYEKRAEQFARKGTKHEVTQAEAAAKPLSFEDIINRKPGERVSAAELERIAVVHKQVKQGFDAILDDAVKAAEDIGAGKRPELATAFKAHLQAIELTNPAFLGGVGEAGRALEFTKTMQGLIGESRLVDGVLKSLAPDALHNGSDEAIGLAISKMGMLSKEGRDKFIEKSGQGYKPGIMHSFFKNLLFLSPSTHVVNTTGSIMAAMGKMGTKTVESVFKDGPTMTETAAMWGGTLNAMLNLPRTWRQAVTRSTKYMDKAGLEGAEDFIARYGTGRLMALEDELIAGPLEAGLVQAAAVRKGLEKKLSKTDLRTFVDELMDDPVKVQGLIDEVAPEVQETLWHAPLSKWGEQGAQWIRNSPLDFWLPIIKFPVNSLKVARDWTPGIQVLSKKFADELAEGGAKEAAARNRMTMSWMFSNMIWSATKAGIITDGGPKDLELNRQWRAAGNVPYAINGAPIRWAEPFGTVIGAVSDMAAVSNQMDPGDVSDFVGGLSLVMSRAVENNYWIRILEGLTEVVTDVKKAATPEDLMMSASKVLINPAVTVASGGPLGYRFREQYDAEVKDIRSLKDFYLAKIPGYSKEVPPRLNYSGNPVLIPPVLGHRALSFVLPPLRTPDGDSDPVAQFLDKHEIQLRDDWRSYGGSADPDRPLETPTGQAAIGVPLNASESHDWKKLSLQHAQRVFNNKTWNETIAELDGDPAFENLSRKKKQDKVSFLYSRYKQMGWKMFKQANPEMALKEEAAKALTKESQGRVPFTVDEPDSDFDEPIEQEQPTPQPMIEMETDPALTPEIAPP